MTMEDLKTWRDRFERAGAEVSAICTSGAVFVVDRLGRVDLVTREEDCWETLRELENLAAFTKA